MNPKADVLASLFKELPRSQERELLDEPGVALDDLPRNLRDIRSLNRWFGGTRLALAYVFRLGFPETSLRVLDVATGSADIPAAIQRRARNRDISLEVAALDVHPEVLNEARRFAAGASVELVEGDALDLPFKDESFDVVLCCLALHHFNREQARKVLLEMWRVTRKTLLVIDVYRSRPAYAGVWLASRLLTRNPMTRNDAPLSVLRAYTLPELRRLAVEAGLTNVHIRRHLFFRQALLATKSDSP